MSNFSIPNTQKKPRKDLIVFISSSYLSAGILKGVPIKIKWARIRGVNRFKRMSNGTNEIDQQFRSRRRLGKRRLR
jgi:hypothetical protein